MVSTRTGCASAGLSTSSTHSDILGIHSARGTEVFYGKPSDETLYFDELRVPGRPQKNGSRARAPHTMLVAAETAPAIKDFTGAAISFFNNHRVPAALLAASSIKDAFVLQGRGSKLPEDDARAWRLVRYAYLLLMITSFGMEMCAVELFNRSVPACTL